MHLRQDGLGCVAVADQEYPDRVLFALLIKMAGEFHAESGGRWAATTTDFSLKFSQLDAYLQKYQNPKEADPIMRVQETLTQTEGIVVRCASLAPEYVFLLSFLSVR